MGIVSKFCKGAKEMSQEKQTYLEEQLGAEYKVNEDKISIIFQKEKIKLDDESEIAMLNEVGSSIEKQIIFTEDELILEFHKPSNLKTFSQLKKSDERSRMIFAAQLIKKVKSHRFTRLHLFICPDNLLIDESLTPHFLHYGVKESLPPYENEPKEQLNALKATIAAAVDGKYQFKQYLQFNQTIDLTPLAADIVAAESVDELLLYIQTKIKQLEKNDKQFLKVEKKKWKGMKYTVIGLSVILIPLIVFSLYTAFITQPKQNAYIKSQESFLKDDYSQVINTLSGYDVPDMPRVTQYQLAHAYLVNESLSESQRKNILNTLTLQADQRYSQYWIYIGRGEPEEALKISRELEDYDLIMYALIHFEEAVKADQSLDEEEKQQQLNDIQNEKEEYERNMEEQEEGSLLNNEEEAQETSTEEETTEEPPVEEKEQPQQKKKDDESKE